ncbi:MAG TPA: hypothetical protein VG797_00010 [Phycisphaerales bacterium]|nr:hypothetical protein [Phycisphaerales bacterium]
MAEPHVDELLKRFLAERQAQCPLCKYELAGLVSPRCPECGTELRLCLAGDALPMREWVVGMIGACTAVGAVVLFWIMAVMTLFLGGGRAQSPHVLFWVGMVTATGTAVSAMWWWTRNHMWLRRRGKLDRGIAAMTCWLYVMSPYIVMVLGRRYL